MRPISEDREEPIWLFTDASEIGVGSWLGQGTTPETARPAILHSRKFSNAQMNYGTTDKEALAIMDALSAFAHMLMGREFTIVTDHQPLIYLYRVKNPSKKQMRWRNELGKFCAKIIYKPGATNHLADALSRIYENQNQSKEDVEHLILTDDTDEDPIVLFSNPSLNMSTSNYYEPIGAHSECGSDCSITEGNTWGDKVSLTSTPPEQREHAALHERFCFDKSCTYHPKGNKFFLAPIGSNTPKDDFTGDITYSDDDSDENHCTMTEWGYCFRKNCPKHGEGKAVEAKVTVIPPTMDDHRRELYEIIEEEESENPEPTHLERIEDERDAASLVSQMTTVFRKQMINAYRHDALYKMVMDPNHPNKDLKHYRIRDGLIYATTRRGEDCLYIPKGHGVNGETLRELVLDEIHGKGHHSAERNLRYATEYLFWPEMRKDFTDFVKQCQLCQENRESYTLSQGRMQMLPIPTEVFTSYAIDMAGPFNTSTGKDTILVVVDRCVGYAWFIPTTTKATVAETLSLLQDVIFSTHGIPMSIITDSDPRFTSRFWRQTMKSLGIEHIMAAPRHHETNGQAERKIRELKTALTNMVNKRQNNWAQALPELAAYSNAGYSDTLGMSPYKAVFGQEYPLLTTIRFKNSSVPAADDYLNRHQQLRNTAFQALTLARMRSNRAARKRRRNHTPIKPGEHVMVLANQFSTMSGRSKKLEARWRGPFKIISYDDFTENYTVAMESRIYRRDIGTFHCSVVKKYHMNDDNRFPGRSNPRPAPILVNENPEWEVETILDHRTRHGHDQFLVQWMGYPTSENSWEPLEGLENSMDKVREWWDNNKPGETLDVETNFITIAWSPTFPDMKESITPPEADDGFWAPFLDTDYDPMSEEEEYTSTDDENRTMEEIAHQF